MDPATLENLRQALLLFIVLMLSVALHEFGHAKVADLRGDPLPRAQGRVTLNPLAHWDFLGTLLPALFILGPALLGTGATGFVIGWGKPVMISLPNPKTRVRDDILITLAGPAMNLLIALFAVVVGGLFIRFANAGDVPMPAETLQRVADFAELTVSMNIFLLAFNLLPLPPLDGSHILRHALRMKDETYAWLLRNSFWIFLALVFIPVAGAPLLSWISLPFRLLFGVPLTLLLRFIAGV